MKKYWILLALMICALPCLFAQTYALGDVNHSGAIDIVDALVVAQYYVGSNPSSYYPGEADVNSSGGVDIVDALLIAQYYVGLINQFPGQTQTAVPTAVVTTAPTIAPTSVPTQAPTNPPTSSGPEGWGRNTTGGTGGQTINVTTLDQLKTAGSQSGSAIIVIQNNITAGTQQVNISGNKTVMGAGSGIRLDFGFTLTGDNIIVKNLDMMNGGFNTGDTEGQDCITMNGRQNIWIDHCTFHEAMDGLVDPCKNSKFVTISYCYFYHQKTCMLIGDSDSDSTAIANQANSDKSLWSYTVTVHHCWFSDSYERNPRVRFGAVHVYNNFYENLPSYAIGKGAGCNVYSENNYFYNTTSAIKAYDNSSNPGYVEDVGSLFEGSNGSTTDFPPPSNWAWKPSTYYTYTLHTADWVKTNLKNYAGMGKGNP
jgi:pectate lyase